MAVHIEHRIQTHNFLRCILFVHLYSVLGTIAPSSRPNRKSIPPNHCPPGYYGAGCVSKCPSLCDVTCTNQGHCTSCPTPGFKLPDCMIECGQGTYGLNCQNNCSQACQNSECDIFVGHCHHCKASGVKLPYCNITCVNGSYGPNCENRCPLTCKESCDPVNGTCTVCSYGQGPQCMVNCAIDTDQEACKLYCPVKCQTLCNTTNGKCSFCASGYEAPFCNSTCRPGTYGSNCKDTCSNRCKDGLCDPFTGACFSCSDGYVGRKCNGQCIPGYYGQECDLVCPETCLGGACDFVNGSCHGCLTGYKGQQCDELCSDGRHGENCTMECPGSCFKACDPVTGECWRCAPGYKGAFCNNTCPNGTYGEGCTNMCHKGCHQFVCDPVNGDCFKCKPGLQGLKCDVKLSVGEGSKLHLALYVTFGLLTVILLFGTSMCCYKHMVNKYEAKIRGRSKIISDKKNAYQDMGVEGEQGMLYKKNVIRSRNDFNLLNAEKSNHVTQEERERNRKLVKYVLNHGKTYTPQGCASAMKQLEKITSDNPNKIITIPPLLGEPTDPQAKQSPLVPDRSEVSLTISTTADSKQVMEINASTENRKLQPVLNGANQISESTTRFNATYKMNDKAAPCDKTSHLEVSSVANFNRRKPRTLEECFRARNMEHMSQTVVTSNENILQDPVLTMPLQPAQTKAMTITSTTVSVVAHQTECNNRMADSMTMIMTQSVKSERCRDAASADSLYGVSSQEFCQETTSSKLIDDPTESTGIILSGSVKLRQEMSVSAVTQVASAHGFNKKDSAHIVLGSGHLNRVISEHAVFQRLPSDHPSSKPDFVFKKQPTPGAKSKHNIPSTDSLSAGLTDHQEDVVVEQIKAPKTQNKSLALTVEDVSKSDTTHQQSRSDQAKDEPKSTCSLSSRRDNSGSSSQMSASGNIKKNRTDKMKTGNTEERNTKRSNKHNDYTAMKASGLHAMKSTDTFVHRKRYTMDSSSSSESTASLRPKTDAFDEMIFNSNFNPVANKFSSEEVHQSHKSRAATKTLTLVGSKSSFPTSRPKQYRKLSPPKVKNHASRKSSADHSDYSESSGKEEFEVKCLARRSDVNAHLLRDEQRRESAGPITQFSYVRSSSSAMIKGELLSPRLVRCATTRQLSPLYGHKPSTPLVSRLQPLPTPPPEGRMKLKPVSKNSSISQNSGGSTHGTEYSDGP